MSHAMQCQSSSVWCLRTTVSLPMGGKQTLLRLSKVIRCTRRVMASVTKSQDVIRSAIYANIPTNLSPNIFSSGERFILVTHLWQATQTCPLHAWIPDGISVSKTRHATKILCNFCSWSVSPFLHLHSNQKKSVEQHCCTWFYSSLVLLGAKQQDNQFEVDQRSQYSDKLD